MKMCGVGGGGGGTSCFRSASLSFGLNINAPQDPFPKDPP